jgi:hypothetical protein
VSVGLVVNVYERTYRDVLRPGFFHDVVASNLRPIDEVVALVNNVDEPQDARRRAEALVRSGEISAYSFVAEHIDRALMEAHLSPRVLRRRPYLLDYGLVLPHVTSTTWLLGWDAETQLVEPVNWIDPAIALMHDDPNIFHASLNWPPMRPEEPGVEAEAFEMRECFALNWGFSDQLFLVRRADLAGPIYRSFSPAAIVRHAPHPYTFEYRLESYQRAWRRPRATLVTQSYRTNHMAVGVIERTGRTAADALRLRALRKLEFEVIDRLPGWVGPRFSKLGSAVGVASVPRQAEKRGVS